MDGLTISTNDEMVIKLLHYFITEQGYHPIILHGVKDEIWLENLDSDYKIVRIVSNYIHNDEQLDFDLYKTNQIVKKIKRKTFSHKMNALSFFVNLGDNVHLSQENCFYIKNNKDIKSNKVILNLFPNIMDKLKFDEKGLDLFIKITDDINKVSEEENRKAEEVFQNKTPYITYILLALNILIYILFLTGELGIKINSLALKGVLVKEAVLNGEIYRLITYMFLHGGLVHLLSNCYTLYLIGPQIENFFGKIKFILIYFISGIVGGLFSILLTNGASIGASGAIFGLFGALLYFGYHYRVYLGNVLKSRVIPLIIFNLAISFLYEGIDSWCHIGGLIGGALISMALGVKYKSTKQEKINGYIILSILIGFIVFLLTK